MRNIGFILFPSNMRKISRKALFMEMLIPIALFYFISNYIIGSLFFVNKMDIYAPTLETVTLRTYVEKQLMHLEAKSRSVSNYPKVLIVGSSSVANGVDENIIQQVWTRNGFKASPLKHGLTGFLAYELPLIKKFLLKSDVKTVVYLYNMFSFGDILQPEGVSLRWSTRELFKTSIWKKVINDPSLIAKGLLTEIFFVVKYRNLIKELIIRLIEGRLEKLPHQFDYQPGSPRPQKRNLKEEDPLPPTHWVRMSLLASDSGRNTIGYQGLVRFFILAKKAGIQVIVAPIPLPEFSLVKQHKVGISQSNIDKRVKNLANKFDVINIERKTIKFIEKDDTYFQDHVHLHDMGRDVYSRWLANYLIQHIGL